MTKLGKKSRIKDHNASPLIGRSFESKHNQDYRATVIWHQARGGQWPDDYDIIFYVWELDGNGAYCDSVSYKEFIGLFDVGSDKEIRTAFREVEIEVLRRQPQSSKRVYPTP
jgi:hypothetical protein